MILAFIQLLFNIFHILKEKLMCFYYMIKFLSLLGLGLWGFFVNANVEETELRLHLFEDYNKDIRPVDNFIDPVNCYMGMQSKI